MIIKYEVICIFVFEKNWKTRKKFYTNSFVKLENGKVLKNTVFDFVDNFLVTNHIHRFSTECPGYAG